MPVDIRLLIYEYADVNTMVSKAGNLAVTSDSNGTRRCHPIFVFVTCM